MKKIVLILTIAILLIAGSVYAASFHGSATASVTAQNTWTGALKVFKNIGSMNLSIYGASAWVATVTLQRRFTSAGTWMTVKTYTISDATDYSIQERVIDFEPDAQYRLGVDTGDYTSGTISLRLSN